MVWIYPQPSTKVWTILWSSDEFILQSYSMVFRGDEGRLFPQHHPSQILILIDLYNMYVCQQKVKRKREVLAVARARM